MHSLSTLRRRLQALLDGGALSRDEFETLDGLVGGAEHEARQRAGYDVLDRGIAPIIDALVSLAALNFGRELPLTGEDERVDAIAAGVNMLAEELQSSVVSLDFVRDIIDSMAESLVVTDHDGIIQLVNESTGRLVERPLEALRGEHISCLGGHSETSASRLLADLEPAATAEAVVDYVDARGRRTPILLSVRRLCPRDDRPSLYVWVGKDIRARLQLERELREARDAAVASAAAKGEFLANMSHEIRTPMNAVIGLTGLLLETALDERQRGFVELVRTSGETLLALINDILDFSKIESGELELERAPMSVRDCVENALDVVTATAAAKSIELLARVDLDVPVAVYGDATRVQQTLVNLLGNAVKFTGRGEVMLSVGARALPGARGVELEWVVRDSGIGIPAHAVPRLFDAFSQAETSTTRRFGGTGLG
ncbi:MAG: PAS domain S-box protein, partial [Myxococcales bacterium]|nr:PAS domain S-box protein [Myxococcales bacterium]